MRPKPLIVRLYARAVRSILPADLVAAHGREMVRTFRDLHDQATREGGRRRLGLIGREVRGLFRTALAERQPFSQRRRLPMLERTRRHLSHAARALRARPSFTFVIVMTLGLAIGANVSTFAVVDAVLLEPFPYHEPSEIVVVWNTWEDDGRHHALSVPELWDYRERARSLDSLAVYYADEANLTGGGTPERVALGSVSTNFFDTLGVSPVLGRTFAAGDDEQTVILSHGTWMRRFGGRDDARGETILLDGTPRTVVGVLPADFVAPFEYEAERPSDLFVAFAPDPADEWNRGGHSLRAVARLAAGETAESASIELDTIAQNLTDEGLYKVSMKFGALAVPLAQELVGSARTPLVVLLGAVALVLLVATTNIASLLLARAKTRTREMALHSALGASRRSVAIRVLAECALLALASAGAGLVVASLALRTLSLSVPEGLPRAAAATLDGRLVAVCLLAAAVCGILFSLPAALASARAPLATALQSGSRGTVGRGGTRFLRALAAAQVGLTAALLVGAVLLLRSFYETTRIDPGFETEDRVSFRVALPESEYDGVGPIVSFYDRLVQAVGELPGVEAAGAGRYLPLDLRAGTWSFDIEDRPTADDESRHSAYWQVVTPGFLEAMGIPLLEGRTLDSTDRTEARLAAVVSRSLAERHWPGESALGKRIRIARAPAPWIDVVGVVDDVRHNDLLGEPLPQFYIPHAQWSVSRGYAFSDMSVVVRSPLPAESLIESLGATVSSLDPNLPMARVTTLEAVVDRSVSRPRFTALLIGVFAGVALVIATVGIYAVLAHSVSERIPEMGLRMALGADRASLLKLVLREGLLIAGAGSTAGIVVAILAGGSLRALLYGVTEHDIWTFALVWIASIAVGTLAALMPARRASRVSPVRALGSL